MANVFSVISFNGCIVILGLSKIGIRARWERGGDAMGEVRSFHTEGLF